MDKRKLCEDGNVRPSTKPRIDCPSSSPDTNCEPSSWDCTEVSLENTEDSRDMVIVSESEGPDENATRNADGTVQETVSGVDEDLATTVGVIVYEKQTTAKEIKTTEGSMESTKPQKHHNLESNIRIDERADKGPTRDAIDTSSELVNGIGDLDKTREAMVIVSQPEGATRNTDGTAQETVSGVDENFATARGVIACEKQTTAEEVKPTKGSMESTITSEVVIGTEDPDTAQKVDACAKEQTTVESTPIKPTECQRGHDQECTKETDDGKQDSDCEIISGK